MFDGTLPPLSFWKKSTQQNQTGLFAWNTLLLSAWSRPVIITLLCWWKGFWFTVKDVEANFIFLFLVINLKPFFFFLLYHLLIGCFLSHYYSSYHRRDVGTSKCPMRHLSWCLKLSLAVKRGDHTTVQPCVITMSYHCFRSQVEFTRDSLFFVFLPPPCLWFTSIVLGSWKGINETTKKKETNMLRCLEVCL